MTRHSELFKKLIAGKPVDYKFTAAEATQLHEAIVYDKANAPLGVSICSCGFPAHGGHDICDTCRHRANYPSVSPQDLATRYGVKVVGGAFSCPEDGAVVDRTPALAELALRYGAHHHGGCVSQREDGVFVCVFHDIGPNLVAAGEGKTPEEAIANVTRAKYGYRLRFDFLGIKPGTERFERLGEFLHGLTHEQKNMIVELMDLDRLHNQYHEVKP